MLKIRLLMAYQIIALVLLLVGCGVSSTLRQADAVAGQFLNHLQTRQYLQARSLLMKSLQSTMDEKALKTRWQALEQTVGTVQSWSRTNWQVFSGTQRYVDLTYQVRGTKGTTATVALRLVPEGQGWKIAQVGFQL